MYEIEILEKIKRLEREIQLLKKLDRSQGVTDHGDLEGLSDHDHLQYVRNTSDETINGIKTFGSIPILPASDPTSDNQAARKKYVDDKAGSIGLWNNFTPTWNSSASNPSLGNGAIYGRYTVIGKTCHYSLGLHWGSTTTGGSGRWEFELPVKAVYTESGVRMVGQGIAIDSSANQYRHGAPIVYPGTTFTDPCLSCFFREGVTTQYYASYAIPFTWASGDTFFLQITYEIE